MLCLSCCPLLLGHPVPTGSPMGLPTFFFLLFFFFSRHVLCPFVVKKTTDWAEILQNHTYGHASFDLAVIFLSPGGGGDNFNMMKTIIIAVCSAVAYLAIVIGLTVYCSLRMMKTKKLRKQMEREAAAAATTQQGEDRSWVMLCGG